MKNPSRYPAQDAEYMYDEYDDYPHESNNTNESNTVGNGNSLSLSSSPLPSMASSVIVTPQAIGHNIDGSKPTSNPSKSYNLRNNTIPGKKSPSGIPPSPSSSGFTFFGVPLPSLSFSLWGNSGKKADRKDDSAGVSASSSISTSSSSSPSLSSSSLTRPGRGRYRNFPPTEPEIHRGGFVPLPRGSGGFVPIPDPRIEQRRVNGTSKNFNKEKESGTQVVHERKNVKTSNYTLGKIERTSGPLTNAHTSSKIRSSVRPFNRDRDDYPPSTSTKTSSSVSFYQKPTKETTTTVHDSSEEADETLVSTEIYGGESLEIAAAEYSAENNKGSSEVASRIVWTTPKTRTSTLKSMIKETITAAVEVFPSKRMSASGLRDTLEKGNANRTRLVTPMASGVNGSSSPDVVSTEASNSKQEMIMEQPRTSTAKPMTMQTSEPPTTSQVSRSMEASALSALLIPGGQVQPVQISGSNIRPLGRPKITKVPSPHLESNNSDVSIQEKTNEKVEKLLSKDDNHLSGTSVDETVKLIEDNDFNWYFQHYNDTDIEPYVGIVYGSNKATLTNVYYWQILWFQVYYFVRYIF